jgi:hypothetical protein
MTETLWQGIVRRFKNEEDDELTIRRFSKSLHPSSKRCQQFDSVIISSIFNDFSTKSSILLYRGSRDGFDSTHCHNKIYGHSHTITLVETTNGFLFSEYMVCESDSNDR